MSDPRASAAFTSALPAFASTAAASSPGTMPSPGSGSFMSFRDLRLLARWAPVWGGSGGRGGKGGPESATASFHAPNQSSGNGFLCSFILPMWPWHTNCRSHVQATHNCCSVHSTIIVLSSHAPRIPLTSVMRAGDGGNFMHQLCLSLGCRSLSKQKSQGRQSRRLQRYTASSSW